MSAQITDFSGAAPDHIAVRVDRFSIRYRDFNNHILQVTSWLGAQGVSAGDTVGIYSKNPYWMWLLHLAAIRISCRHLTMLPPYAAEFAEQSGMNVFVGDSGVANIAGLECKKIVFDGSRSWPSDVLPNSAEWRNAEVSGESAGPERVAFTTGTTGTPKAVLWTAKMLRQRIGQVGGTRQLTTSTTLYCDLGMETTAGFRYPLATWRQGGTVLLGTNRQSRSKMARASSLAVFAPGQINDVLSRTADSWPRCKSRHLILLGGRAHKTLLTDCYERVASSITIAYGSTEAGSVVTGDAMLTLRHPGACGYVRSGCEVEVVDSQHQPLPPGKRGMVRVKSPSIATSYFSSSKEAETTAAFRDGWFYPGDLGAIAEDGLVVILGRDADVVNIGGRKVSLTDLEGRLNDLQEIKDCCFINVESDRSAKLHALVVTDQDDNWLQNSFRSRVGDIGSISVLRVSSIPRNAMGKIPRNQIADKLKNQSERVIRKK